MKIISYISIITLSLSSCSIDNVMINDIDKEAHPISLSVTDNDYISYEGLTRTSESGYNTAFTSQDRVGMYIVDGTNKVIKANMCFTYDGTNWTSDDEFLYNKSIMSAYKFFAYYPYQSTFTNAPVLGATNTATDAETFFSSAISSWTLTTDQTSRAKYAANDLMVGTGIVGNVLGNLYPVAFAMKHQMALVDFNLPYVYLSTNSNYGFTSGLTCTSFFPYHLSLGTYRYIVKPSTATTLSGYYCTSLSINDKMAFSVSVPALTKGTYSTATISGGSTNKKSYTLAVGDFLLNDGGIVPNAATNTYLLSCLSRSIAVVFNTSTSTNDQNAGFKSGYALALKNAAAGVAWSSQATTQDLTTPLVNTVPLMEADLDGLTHCNEITKTGGSLNSYTSTNYPAFYYAMTFGTTDLTYASPTQTSGWYLPSIGQWYKIYYNLCGITTDASVGGDGNATPYYGYWFEATTAATNLNKYFNKVYTYNTTVENLDYVVDTSSIWFWTSSEFTNIMVCIAYFYNDNTLYLYRTTKLDDISFNRVRSVIAF